MSSTPTRKHYPDVDPSPDFAAIERRILEHWREDGTFQASIDARPAGKKGKNEFVFYDGPPFANGLPHYGHLVTSYIKDVVPRYQTLRGRRVERRFGWDCHGLPAEMEAERELEVTGRAKIIEYGIERFNAHCRNSVMKYAESWEQYVNRAARWVDFENDYKTLELDYMESTIWAVKQLWEKGLLYEGYKVMPYSWAAQTSLSNHETRLDDSYRERQDPAITVRFELLPEAGDEAPTDLLAWTTTPWTLPSNLALAVGEDIDYAILEHEGRRVILAETTLEKLDSELAGAERVGTRKGRDLVGRHYTPLFPFFASTEKAFVVLSGAFVNTEEGTGIVHLAPGFGEDDMAVCDAAGIPVVCPVDDAGRFTDEVADWAGLQVFDANKPIVRALRDRGALVKQETYLHNYPHCWRTDEPLIYKALDSWYVKVSAVRERMVEVNREINWIPEHVRDGLFGRWLEGARDWSISRNRFWGTPIPVWKSDDPAHPRIDVYGSLDELERDFGVRPDDLHRPFVDELTRPNPDDPSGKSTMRRVSDVLDCWFESGSMPFAQVHYPFENKEWFDEHFPADFITEYQAQTRGWFYVMTVLSTALFDRPPFKSCVCHGVVLDEDGKKLSKRLRNYPDPIEVFDELGSDALRWFLVASPVMSGGNLRIAHDDRQIREAVRTVLNPIWNAWYFFSLYANTDGIQARFRADSEDLLDRYILAKTQELVERLAADLDAYDFPGACSRVLAHIDALNNWYIRRSRNRFWKAEKDQSKQDAYDTLYTVLVTLCRAASPLLPLISEEIHGGLTGARSVHLCDWPEELESAADPQLVAEMDRVREVCSAALALRAAKNVRVRQPLAELVVAGKNTASLEPYLDLVASEVNVKSIRLTDDIEEYATFRLQVNARALGPRLGAETKRVIKASKEGDWRALPAGGEDTLAGRSAAGGEDTLAGRSAAGGGGGVEVAGHELGEGEFELLLQPREGVACESLPSNDAIAVLDLELSEELVQEGRARDVVRAVQQARKEAGLHVSDRIHLVLGLEEDWRAAVDRFRDYVGQQTLATEIQLDWDPDADDILRNEASIGGSTVRIGLRRAPAA
ncbi:MAG: isoleucine--tRNA ligase [Deltaproteobacteria bacterium]|nr:isoleucine--tRNA ligase [Deltaproteobacteria bacterium]MBW2420638.1 isoleucine--tRNA ligase [Deltaproteobacteria bacterium]